MESLHYHDHERNLINRAGYHDYNDEAGIITKLEKIIRGIKKGEIIEADADYIKEES